MPKFKTFKCDILSNFQTILGEEEGRDKLLLCLSSGGNCAPFSTDLIRYLQDSPEEFEDDSSGLVEVPDRRSSYLFRSRRSAFDPKRSSTYLWRTRKAYLDPRGTRAGKEYLFRTRKMDPRLATRGNYLFRTRKADALMDRMLRSSKSYLFRTR